MLRCGLTGNLLGYLQLGMCKSLSRVLLIFFFTSIFLPFPLRSEDKEKPTQEKETKAAETNTTLPAGGPEAFDFWIGDWNLSWPTPDGKTAKGTNVVTKILDGKVIQENFDGGDSMPFKGRSWSVYVEKAKTWKQTWVDNNGGYLDFKGGWQDDQMILYREGYCNGKPCLQKMRFYNIEEDTLDWIWEISFDYGQTWHTAWEIHYERQKPE